MTEKPQYPNGSLGMDQLFSTKSITNAKTEDYESREWRGVVYRINPSFPLPFFFSVTASKVARFSVTGPFLDGGTKNGQIRLKNTVSPRILPMSQITGKKKTHVASYISTKNTPPTGCHWGKLYHEICKI